MNYFFVLFFWLWILPTWADDFSISCEKGWHREDLQPQLIELLETPEKNDREKTQALLSHAPLAELEFRLLQKTLSKKKKFEDSAKELEQILKQQVSCSQADLTASGVPLKNEDYAQISKSFSYFEIHRADIRLDEINGETKLVANKSYDTTQSLTENRWRWVALAAVLITGVYIQQNYQIEY